MNPEKIIQKFEKEYQKDLPKIEKHIKESAYLAVKLLCNLRKSPKFCIYTTETTKTQEVNGIGISSFDDPSIAAVAFFQKEKINITMCKIKKDDLVVDYSYKDFNTIANIILAGGKVNRLQIAVYARLFDRLLRVFNYKKKGDKK